MFIMFPEISMCPTSWDMDLTPGSMCGSFIFLPAYLGPSSSRLKAQHLCNRKCTLSDSSCQEQASLWLEVGGSNRPCIYLSA